MDCERQEQNSGRVLVKARMVVGGHKNEVPATLTYSSVVSRDSVRIALTIAALNELEVLASDIHNAFLTAK